MKLQNLLLVAVFAIFIIQVQADYDDFEEWEHETPKSCEEAFETNACNDCQKLMWSHFENPGQCATAINLGKKIFQAIKDANDTPKPYDLQYFEKGLVDYCHQGFNCKQNEAEKIYNEIQEVCSNELSVKFDWSEDPRTFTDKTAYAAYGTLLVYYTGIPSREALCLKENNDEFCSIKFIRKFVNWMKEATYADEKAIVSHDHKFVIKGDGTKIPVPKSFQCDPCWRKMVKIFIDYFEHHKLKQSVADNIWGDEHEGLPECGNKRGLAFVMKERNESKSNFNKRNAMPSFNGCQMMGRQALVRYSSDFS
ncbi:6684_t:CDS:2 [Funneliformis geosporum]|nr:6684_t:CDS:2 [Funneliformis geosporum]